MKYNIPLVKRDNFYSSDEYIKSFFRNSLPKKIVNDYEPFLKKIGKASAQSLDHSILCDQNPPKLIKYNELGELQNKIEYHESYKKLKEASYGNGLLEIKYDSTGLNGPDKAYRHFVGFMANFLFSQVDTGLFCPICMTDSLAWVLEKHLQKNLKNKKVHKALKGLTNSDLDQLFEGAMFLTERQGGSDVGANTVEAFKEDGIWKIKGHKWFCSNSDAELALILARMPDALEGTKGLGLFLFEKSVAKNYEIIRLKDKLGVRSMASGEIEFRGTAVTLLSGANEGFKQMAEMVNMSRIYNSIASLGASRRAIEEARLWGEQRQAFGKNLEEHALWKRQLDELDKKFRALFELIFKAVGYLDAYETGDKDSLIMFRLLTPVVKAACGKFGVYCVSECMELIGGNAYIEDFKFAKIYRDVQVLPIWEGTTNIQAFDLLRVFSKEQTIIDKLDKVFKEEANAHWIQFKKHYEELSELKLLEAHADELLFSFCDVWLCHLGYINLRKY